MLLHDHPVDLHGAGEPAGRSLLPPTEAAASAGGEAGAGADGGAATGAGGGPELGKVPHLPSIKESMPFLSSLGEPAAGKLGQLGQGTAGKGRTSRSSGSRGLLNLGAAEGRKHQRLVERFPGCKGNWRCGTCGDCGEKNLVRATAPAPRSRTARVLLISNNLLLVVIFVFLSRILFLLI